MKTATIKAYFWLVVRFVKTIHNSVPVSVRLVNMSHVHILAVHGPGMVLWKPLRTVIPSIYDIVVNIMPLPLCIVELIWSSGSLLDCHATARGSIPGGNGGKPSFMPFARDSKWGAVSKNWPRCRWDVTHKQPTSLHKIETYEITDAYVCLFGFNVALKHLRSYHDGVCL